MFELSNCVFVCLTRWVVTVELFHLVGLLPQSILWEHQPIMFEQSALPSDALIHPPLPSVFHIQAHLLASSLPLPCCGCQLSAEVSETWHTHTEVDGFKVVLVEFSVKILLILQKVFFIYTNELV